MQPSSYNSQSTIGNLFLERHNTDQYGRQSIQFYGVILWNSLPPEIRNLTTTVCFRTELKNIISLSMLCEILCICLLPLNDYFLFSNSDNSTDIYFSYA